MNEMRNLSGVCVFVAALLLAGCAGQERREEPEPKPPEPVERPRVEKMDDQEYVNMYSFGGDDWRKPWQPDLTPPARFDLSVSTAASADETDNGEPELTQGFRIQLADVLEHGRAVELQERAQAFFDHVYLTFRSPNYKVRAGDFKSRGEAERKLEMARGAGFRDAWIVPDWVYVNPPEVVPDSLVAGADSLAAEVEAGNLEPLETD